MTATATKEKKTAKEPTAGELIAQAIDAGGEVARGVDQLRIEAAQNGASGNLITALIHLSPALVKSAPRMN